MERKSRDQFCIRSKWGFLFWTIHPNKKKSIKTFVDWVLQCWTIYPEFQGLTQKQAWRKLKGKRYGWKCVNAEVTIKEITA